MNIDRKATSTPQKVTTAPPPSPLPLRLSAVYWLHRQGGSYRPLASWCREGAVDFEVSCSSLPSSSTSAFSHLTFAAAAASAAAAPTPRSPTSQLRLPARAVSGWQRHLILLRNLDPHKAAFWVRLRVVAGPTAVSEGARVMVSDARATSNNARSPAVVHHMRTALSSWEEKTEQDGRKAEEEEEDCATSCNFERGRGG
jgi:hypothetical protein